MVLMIHITKLFLELGLYRHFSTPLTEVRRLVDEQNQKSPMYNSK